MLQYIDAQGRIRLTDDAVFGAPAIFDTDDGMLFVDPADYFTGSISLPSRSAVSSGASGSRTFVDVADEYYIGTPSSPSANIALGQFCESGDTFWKSSWGSHILNASGAGDTTVPQTDLVSQNFLTALRTVTPFINNLGHLALRERTVMRARDPGSPPTITLTFPAFTLDYKLFCGAWWGNPLIVPRADAGWRNFQPFNGTASSFSQTVDVGYGYPGRILLLAIETLFGAATVSSVTVGGVGATILGSIATGSTRVTFVAVASATGTSKAITVNLSASTTGCYINVLGVRSLTGSSPTMYSSSSASATSTSLSIPATANATAIVAVAKNSGGTTPPTWTNADQVYDFATSLSGTPAALSVAIMSAVNGSNVTAAWGGAAGQISMLGAVYT